MAAGPQSPAIAVLYFVPALADFFEPFAFLAMVSSSTKSARRALAQVIRKPRGEVHGEDGRRLTRERRSVFRPRRQARHPRLPGKQKKKAAYPCNGGGRS